METRTDGQSTTAPTTEPEWAREQELHLQALQDVRDGKFGVRLPGELA